MVPQVLIKKVEISLSEVIVEFTLLMSPKQRMGSCFIVRSKASLAAVCGVIFLSLPSLSQSLSPSLSLFAMNEVECGEGVCVYVLVLVILVFVFVQNLKPFEN